VAQTLGKGLGRSEILLGALPEKQKKRVAKTIAARFF
jgi:hypothetical protein